jgi:hypothetical protein
MMDFRAELAKISPKAKNGAKIYVWGCGETWERVKRRFRIVAGICLEYFVHAFVDSDAAKKGASYDGKTVIVPTELSVSDSVVFVAVDGGIFEGPSDVGEKLMSMGFHCNSDFFYSWDFNRILLSWNYSKMSRFNGMHKGSRCFIVGNGPSLRIDDLDRLVDEISFASNRIYFAFDKTQWRPTYYQVGDSYVLRDHKTIASKIKCDKFFYLDAVLAKADFESTDAEHSFYFSTDKRFFYRPYPYKFEISTDADMLTDGYNASFILLQLAIIMGCEEIYLIGVDNSFPVSVKHDGTLEYSGEQGHFSKEYETVVNTYPAYVDIYTAAYTAAREYGAAHGVKIRNATRGGKLEVFERVDFDSLF